MYSYLVGSAFALMCFNLWTGYVLPCFALPWFLRPPTPSLPPTINAGWIPPSSDAWCRPGGGTAHVTGRRGAESRTSHETGVSRGELSFVDGVLLCCVVLYWKSVEDTKKTNKQTTSGREREGGEIGDTTYTSCIYCYIQSAVHLLYMVLCWQHFCYINVGYLIHNLIHEWYIEEYLLPSIL